MKIAITYKPEQSKLRFNQETGAPLPPTISHYLHVEDMDKDSDFKTLAWGSVGDFPGVSQLCKQMAAAPDAIDTLTRIAWTAHSLPEIVGMAREALERAGIEEPKKSGAQ